MSETTANASVIENETPGTIDPETPIIELQEVEVLSLIHI
mgnify:CR=1 FL=1